MDADLQLDLHEGELAVCRLGPDDHLPAWAAAPGHPLHALTRTAEELSVVTSATAVPDEVTAERGWRALAVRGPLDFALTGVLARLAQPLADAGVPIFAISTHDTDWLLVPAGHLDAAIRALAAAGHVVHT